METARTCSAAQNIYEDTIMSENTYQTLHCQNPVENRQYAVGPSSSQKQKVLFIFLLILNILILTIILAIVAAHYLHSTQKLIPPRGTGGRVFFMLYQMGIFNCYHMFLLSDHVQSVVTGLEGNCQTAMRFCLEKNATLATVHLYNWDWMMSLADKELPWVRANPNNMDGSGSYISLEDEENCLCEPLGDITKNTMTECEESRGWVCERNAYLKF